MTGDVRTQKENKGEFKPIARDVRVASVFSCNGIEQTEKDPDSNPCH